MQMRGTFCFASLLRRVGRNRLRPAWSIRTQRGQNEVSPQLVKGSGSLRRKRVCILRSATWRGASERRALKEKVLSARTWQPFSTTQRSKKSQCSQHSQWSICFPAPVMRKLLPRNATQSVKTERSRSDGSRLRDLPAPRAPLCRLHISAVLSNSNQL